jgi:hypothetical protein
VRLVLSFIHNTSSIRSLFLYCIRPFPWNDGREQRVDSGDSISGLSLLRPQLNAYSGEELAACHSPAILLRIPLPLTESTHHHNGNACAGALSAAERQHEFWRQLNGDRQHWQYLSGSDRISF